jgi:hypothetical protein
MKLGDEELIYLGRNDGMNRQGGGLIMNKGVAKFCLFWEGINNRMPVAHFTTKKCKVEPTDRDLSYQDEFY